jgi:hypothetical protein
LSWSRNEISSKGFPNIAHWQWHIGVAHYMKRFEMILYMLYKLKVVEDLAIKADVMKFPQLIITYIQESCMWVEVHNDSKKLVGGLKEVAIFAS